MMCHLYTTTPWHDFHRCLNDFHQSLQFVLSSCEICSYHVAVVLNILLLPTHVFHHFPFFINYCEYVIFVWFVFVLYNITVLEKSNGNCLSHLTLILCLNSMKIRGKKWEREKIRVFYYLNSREKKEERKKKVWILHKKVFLPL